MRREHDRLTLEMGDGLLNATPIFQSSFRLEDRINVCENYSLMLVTEIASPVIEPVMEESLGRMYCLPMIPPEPLM